MFALSTINKKVEALAVGLLLLCGTWGLAATTAAQTPARDSSTKPGDEKSVEAPPPPAAVGPFRAGAPQSFFGPSAVAPQAPRAVTKSRGAAAPAAPARPRVSPQPAPPPPGVITVVHRLSGWKLLAWLASTPSPVVEVEDLPFASDVHTNIVAGFVSEDGRTVFARLGQAEAEAGVAAPFGPAVSGGLDGAPDLTLVRRDGQRIKARFIGLDGSTGLSLLEAVTPVIPPAANAGAQRMSVGQRVRLFAPEPVRAPRPPSPAGGEAKIFFSLSESGGRLSELKSAPSGKTTRASVRAPGLGRAWAGAVATDENGAVIGIIADGAAAGEKQLVTAEGMRAAEARVKARRASVPQPWFGARGDAVAAAKLDQLLARGWPRDNARTLLDKGQGILLTEVPPETPAALAGLRTGDVILRVGGYDIKSLEDFSSSLREAGGNSTLDITVLRSLDVSPLKVSVRLSESLDPASATGEAELRAAEAELRGLEREFGALKTKAGESEAQARAALESARAEEDVARRVEDQARLAAARNSIDRAQRLLADSRKEFESADRRFKEVAERFARARRPGVAPFAFQYQWKFNRRPFITGLNTIAISPKIATRFKAQGGLLVTGVLPQTPAAASGLLPGDVIEAVNGQTLPEAESTFEFQTWPDGAFDFDVVREGKKFKLKFSPPDAPAKKKD